MAQTDLQLVISAVDNATKTLKDVSGQIEGLNSKGKKASKETTSGFASLGKTFSSVGSTLATLGVAFGALQLGKLVKDTAMAGASFERLETVLVTVARNSGVTSYQLNEMRRSLKEANVTGKSATEVMLRFIQSGIQGTIALGEFSIMAKDFAQVGVSLSGGVISSKDALTDFTQAVVTGNMDVLRNYGIMTNLNSVYNRYRQEVGATNKILSETQKREAIVMELQRQHKRVIGAYADSYETAEKAISSSQDAAQSFRDYLGLALEPTVRQLAITFRDSFQGMSSDLEKNQNEVKIWGVALVAGFKLTIRVLSNLVTLAARIIAAPFVAAYKVAAQSVSSMKKIVSGGFRDLTANLKGALNDATNAQKTFVSDFTAGIEKDLTDMYDAGVDANFSLLTAIDNLGNQADLTGGQIQDFGEDMETASEDADKFAKKIDTLKRKLADVKKGYKESKKELKESFKEEKKRADGNLAESIANIIITKEQEVADLKSRLGEETTEEERENLNQQIKQIENFLKDHKDDRVKFGREIQRIIAFNNMDEIEQMKYLHEREEEEREKAFENEMEDLKEEYKEKKKEIKRQLKELKEEITKAGLNIINLKYSTPGSNEVTGDDWYDQRPKGTSKGEWDEMHGRKFGGSVLSGMPYTVGENKPEVFVPSQSGNIRQMDQVSGGKEITVNFNNVNVRNDNDLNTIVTEVKRSLQRDNMFSQFGVRT